MGAEVGGWGRTGDGGRQEVRGARGRGWGRGPGEPREEGKPRRANWKME